MPLFSLTQPFVLVAHAAWSYAGDGREDHFLCDVRLPSDNNYNACSVSVLGPQFKRTTYPQIGSLRAQASLSAFILTRPFCPVHGVTETSIRTPLAVVPSLLKERTQTASFGFASKRIG